MWKEISTILQIMTFATSVMSIWWERKIIIQLKRLLLYDLHSYVQPWRILKYSRVMESSFISSSLFDSSSGSTYLKINFQIFIQIWQSRSYFLSFLLFRRDVKIKEGYWMSIFGTSWSSLQQICTPDIVCPWGYKELHYLC